MLAELILVIYFVLLLPISHLIVVVQSDGLEVLQFPQIPQFDGAILGS